MRIIKEGILPIKQETCPEYGCIFEFDERDVFVEDKRRIRYLADIRLTVSSGSYDYVICPCCDKEIVIS